MYPNACLPACLHSCSLLLNAHLSNSIQFNWIQIGMTGGAITGELFRFLVLIFSLNQFRREKTEICRNTLKAKVSFIKPMWTQQHTRVFDYDWFIWFPEMPNGHMMHGMSARQAMYSVIASKIGMWICFMICYAFYRTKPFVFENTFRFNHRWPKNLSNVGRIVTSPELKIWIKKSANQQK